MALLLSVINAV